MKPNESADSPENLRDVYYSNIAERKKKVDESITRLTRKDFIRGADDWANIPRLVELELMHRLHDRLALKDSPNDFATAQRLAAAVLQASPVYHRFIGSTVSQEQLDKKWANLQERMGDNVIFSLLRHADGMLTRFLEERESGAMTEADFDEWAENTRHQVVELFKKKD